MTKKHFIALWVEYIAGECGPNGGKIKPGKGETE